MRDKINLKECHLKYTINPQIDGIEYILSFMEKNHDLINGKIKNKIEGFGFSDEKKEKILKKLESIEKNSDDVFENLFESLGSLIHIQKELIK